MSRAALALLALALASAQPSARAAAEDPRCQTVRLSDVGWTDVTATTALFSTVLRELGYQPQVTLLSVPVTFESMKRGDIDVFLGNWMPAQSADRQPYLEDHSIEVLGANLTGAKYTLAVPAYTYAAGLKSFADIHRFAPALAHTIYGIEPGNDGNRLVLKMIRDDAFQLHDFRLIESSEQGMLAQVERAVRSRAPIVFLAWDPHPMNLMFDMRYLSGGDAVFGPNFGGATVYTTTRAGYAALCPNVARLLRNLRFTTTGESEVMRAMLQGHQLPEVAAAEWLARNPAVRAAWVAGALRWDGRPAPAHAAARPGRDFQLEGWLAAHKIPLGEAMAQLVTYVKTHGTGFFDAVSLVLRSLVNGLNRLLLLVPTVVLLLAIGALTWFLRRSIMATLFVIAALLYIMNQGYWSATLETLSLVLVAAFMATLIGVPLGIAAARHPRFYATLRPVLDLMQTLPTFVYLIPTLVLFGLGVVPGLISTVIFALPAPVRLTQLGVASVPRALVEAGEAFGATRSQLLWKVELPAAAPTILAGITQCIMLSLSMVVIAALVGAGGLGVPVVRALNTVQVGTGFEAGIVIVLLAIILDRISRPSDKPPG